MMIRTPRRLHHSARTWTRHDQQASIRTFAIDHSHRFEEERLPWYQPDHFYPVRVGETLASQYRVVGKLGYGSFSTSWLCRDLQQQRQQQEARFVAVKVCTSRAGTSNPHPHQRELDFYSHVSSLTTQHPGRSFIRELLDTFTMQSPTTGESHTCLVQPPMHMTIRELQFLNSSERLNEQLLKWTLSKVLHALSFLHDEAGVVHTDIDPSNIMLTIDDESLLSSFEASEAEDPSPAKVIDESRTIYASRKFGLPKDALWGQPVLCDFGEARIEFSTHTGVVQPELYRAPEVLFDMPWSSAVDIWSIGTLIWDLFEKRHLFNACLDESNETSATDHIPEMIAYLGGPPPLAYLQRSDVTRNVFDEQGNWKSAGSLKVPSLSLEQAEQYLTGEKKKRFLEFVRMMLQWVPEEMKSATELLRDGVWLRQDRVEE